MPLSLNEIESELRDTQPTGAGLPALTALALDEGEITNHAAAEVVDDPVPAEVASPIYGT